MNIKISAVGTWVINKHSATKQIWLSSPVSGPFKYNYWAEHPHGVKDSETHWLGERDEHSLHDRLRGELRDSLGIDTLDFERVF